MIAAAAGTIAAAAAVVAVEGGGIVAALIGLSGGSNSAITITITRVKRSDDEEVKSA